MFRSIPVQNKLCFQREHERNIQMHETKIRNMRKMVDNEAPPQYEFLVTRKKKEAIAQERENEVQRENMMLLQKLSCIVKRNGVSRQQISVSPNPQEQQPFSQTQGSSLFPKGISKQSLNKDFRKKEFVKIVVENQALLKRIQDSKSGYNVKSWQKDRLRNESYISHISEYQYKSYKPNKTFIKLGVWDSDTKLKTQEFKKPTGKLQPLFKTSQQQKVIYKNGRKIGIYSYLIEIREEKEQLVMTLENLQKKQNIYTLQFPLEEGMNILNEECQGDPELFIDRVKINERSNSILFRKTLEQTQDIENQTKAVEGNHLQVTEEKEEDEDMSFQHSKVGESQTNQQVVQSQNDNVTDPNLQKENQKEGQEQVNIQERGDQTEETHQEQEKPNEKNKEVKKEEQVQRQSIENSE